MSLGGGSPLILSSPATGLNIQTSLQGQAIPIGWGQNILTGNLIWYGDFKTIPHSQSAGGKGGIGGAGKGVTSISYTYSAAVQFGLCEGPIGGIINVWSTKVKTTLSALNLTLFNGSNSQGPWGYLSTNHPTQALSYRGVAHVDAGPLQLGVSPELPNLNYEVLFNISNAIPGLPDANPRDVLYDLLTNPNYGLGFPLSLIGTLTNFTNYCLAAGFVVSPVLRAAATASSFLDDLLYAVNCELVWSAGKLNVVPRGDANLSGNGYSYTAPSAPLFDLGDTDFLGNQASNPNSSASSSTDDPISCTRTDQRKQVNVVQITYLSRPTGQYDPGVAEAKDDSLINQFGPIPDSRTYDFFCDPAPANLSSQLILGRGWVRNSYAFTLGPEFIVLDPMDIVTITDVTLGLDHKWVRITEITENSDGTLSIVADEYPNGSGHSPVYSFESSSGYIPDYGVDPGPVNLPIIFCAPIAVSASTLEAWLLVSGGPLWGGANVWVSYDSTNYQQVGTILGASRMGFTTAPVGQGSADPDLGNTISADLTESKAELLSTSQVDFDAFGTLCWLDGELVAYRDATLTGANNYNLTVLHRGIYGTANVAHASGVQFGRLDQDTFSLFFPKETVGDTVYVKLQSFNLWNLGQQDLSDCVPYPFVISGPQNVFTFGINVESGSLKSLRIWWNPITVPGIAGVEIWRSTTTNFADAIAIADSSSSAYVDAPLTAATTYYYWARAFDDAGNFGPFFPSTATAGVAGTTGTSDTPDITPHAATGHIDVEVAGPITPSSGQVNTFYDLASFVYHSTTGNPIELTWAMAVHNRDTGSHNFQIRIARDGNIIWPVNTPTLTVLNTTWDLYSVLWVDQPGTGDHTYQFQWKPTTTSMDAVNVLVMGDELKR